MTVTIIAALIAIVAIGAMWLLSGARVVSQFERGVVFRFGRVTSTPRQPGLTWVTPGVEKLRKVNMQIVTMPVPAQDGITRDNVSVRVDAVVYFRVIDPVKVIVEVQDSFQPVPQVGRTSCSWITDRGGVADCRPIGCGLTGGLECRLPSPR